MKLGCQSAPTNDTHLKYLARYGVRNICGYPEIAAARNSPPATMCGSTHAARAASSSHL